VNRRGTGIGATAGLFNITNERVFMVTKECLNKLNEERVNLEVFLSKTQLEYQLRIKEIKNLIRVKSKEIYAANRGRIDVYSLKQEDLFEPPVEG
jgi:hypothetical protein